MALFAKKLFILLFIPAVLSSCASDEKIDTDTAKGAYALAEKYEKDERYEEAITYYNEVKNKHPYSHEATDSELHIADIEFLRENYVEAESAYKLFKEFHPEHSKIDYVTYRIGLSVFNQLPPTTDRDLALATVAIDAFENVINLYPKSTHVADSRKKLDETNKMLVGKEFYIADFYYKRKIWLSALGRYEDILREYPNKENGVRALYGATLSAYYTKDMDKAKSYFKKLLNDFPNSKELASARQELSDGF